MQKKKEHRGKVHCDLKADVLLITHGHYNLWFKGHSDRDLVISLEFTIQHP